MDFLHPYSSLSLYKEVKKTKILTNKTCLLNTYTFFYRVVQPAMVKYFKQELVFKA